MKCATVADRSTGGGNDNLPLKPNGMFSALIVGGVPSNTLIGICSNTANQRTGNQLDCPREGARNV